jgi:uncharacterized protein YxeA
VKRPVLTILYIIFFSLLGVLLMSFTKPHTWLFNSISAISGNVSNLHQETLEYVNTEKPTHDHSSIYYKRFYISQFNLDGKAIEAKFSAPMTINNGDSVQVAGYQQGESLQVLAYTNQTQQVNHHENWVVLGLGAIFFFAVAVGLLNSQLVLEGALVPKLFLIGFTLVAIYMGYRALLIREAIGLISNQ